MVCYISSTTTALLQIRTSRMATTEVIDHGLIDLKGMYDSFPPDLMYEEENPASVIAALLWLDTEYKTHQEGDKVVIHPGLFYFLLPTVKVIDNDELAELAAQVYRAFTDEDAPDIDEEKANRLATQWFTISFLETIDDQPLSLHPILKDRTIKVRVLTADEIDKLEAADAVFWAATVRADGSSIPFPPPTAGMSFA